MTLTLNFQESCGIVLLTATQKTAAPRAAVFSYREKSLRWGGGGGGAFKRVHCKISKSKISNRKISNAVYRKTKHRCRKISKSQNIEVAKYRIAKYRTRIISNKQNIVGIAEYRKAKYRKRKISTEKNIECKISNAKYRTQIIEIAKYQNKIQ